MVRSATPTATYGQGEATFQAAGGEAGIRKLVDHFYDIMTSELAYQRIYDWYPDDITARDKLARFLSGWMGRPRCYQERCGPISIPAVHQHLPVTATERDMWLGCMARARTQQDYPQALRDYLMEQFSFPAELIRRRCETE